MIKSNTLKYVRIFQKIKYEYDTRILLFETPSKFNTRIKQKCVVLAPFGWPLHFLTGQSQKAAADTMPAYQC